jgi:hypothetical protein
MACISGVIYAEKGSLPTQGEALQLSGNIRAAYYRGRDKLADWVVFSKDGVNYGFSFGIPEQGKDVYIRIAESALRLGPLPGKQSASPQKTNAYASDFGYTPQRSSAAPIANLAELAFCYVKQYAPQDIKEEGNVKCTGKAELFKQEVVANMRTSADGIACMDNPNLDKIIVAIAEVLWTNQQNSWYTPGSAIPISINIVCEKVKAKAR